MLEREDLLGRLLSCQRKEPHDGTRDKKDSEGGTKELTTLQSLFSLRTHIYSNHTLCTGLAALNYAPRKGLSSRQGFDAGLPGRLCWATI